MHNIDCRVAQQNYNTRTAQTSTSSVKHILKLFPKKFAPGKAAVASTADASGEYATRYYAMYLDGKKVVEVDPLNFIYMVNGKDCLLYTSKPEKMKRKLRTLWRKKSGGLVMICLLYTSRCV